MRVKDEGEGEGEGESEGEGEGEGQLNFVLIACIAGTER